MKKIDIQEVVNGFALIVDEKNRYVFKATDVLDMLAFVGLHFYGKKVQVVEK